MGIGHDVAPGGDEKARTDTRLPPLLSVRLSGQAGERQAEAPREVFGEGQRHLPAGGDIGFVEGLRHLDVDDRGGNPLDQIGITARLHACGLGPRDDHALGGCDARRDKRRRHAKGGPEAMFGFFRHGSLSPAKTRSPDDAGEPDA